jgi:hypothetical protein
MAHAYKLDADGGFSCGNTKTGVTAYAYPTNACRESSLVPESKRPSCRNA